MTGEAGRGQAPGGTGTQRPGFPLSKKKPPERPLLRGGGPAQNRELRAQGRETVRKLLDVGLAEFKERGFHRARVDDMVQRTGVSHGEEMPLPRDEMAARVAYIIYAAFSPSLPL
jgi:hypothetical protein